MRIWIRIAALILALGLTALWLLRAAAGQAFGIAWYWALPFWGVVVGLWFLAGRSGVRQRVRTTPLSAQERLLGR